MRHFRFRDGLFFGLGFGLGLFLLHLGEIDVEGRSLSKLAAGSDPTTSLFDYSVDDGQAQAGSFAGFLGGEKGLKNVGLNLAAHSNTSVADCEDYIFARRDLGMASGKGFVKFDVSGPDGQLAAWGMASRALTARLRITCSICPGSALTRLGDEAGRIFSSMLAGMRRSNIFATSVRTASKSSALS